MVGGRRVGRVENVSAIVPTTGIVATNSEQFRAWLRVVWKL
jgi:hypothetical protein